MKCTCIPHDCRNVVVPRRRSCLGAKWSKLLLLLLLLLQLVLGTKPSIVVLHAMLPHSEPPASCNARVENGSVQMPRPDRLLIALKALHRFLEDLLLLLGPRYIRCRDLPLIASSLALLGGLWSAASKRRPVASRRKRLTRTLLLGLGILE